jgi:hypothetical protein
VGLLLNQWITGSLGVAIVVLEGLQQLKQFHSTWIGYRSTSETLKHEKFLYLGNAGPYVDQATAHALLAARVEEIVSHEHAKWVEVRGQFSQVSQRR